MTDPLTRGIVQVLSGRAPKRGNEVFLTRDAAHQLGVGTGDALRLASPARTSFRVTGVGELATYWGQTEMVLAPGARLPWKALPNGPEVRNQLVDLPAGVRPALLKRLLTSREGAKWGLQISPALVGNPSYDFSHGDAEQQGSLELGCRGTRADRRRHRHRGRVRGWCAASARHPRAARGQRRSAKMLRRVLFLQGP